MLKHKMGAKGHVWHFHQVFVVVVFVIQYVPKKSVTVTISENIPKPRNKFWMLCSDA